MASQAATRSSSSSSSPRLRPIDGSKEEGRADVESGYASGSSSTPSLPQITLTKSHVKHLNEQLENMHPQDILRFVAICFPNLYQSTAFGLSGMVTLDMLSRLRAETPSLPRVDLIFLDTLHYFPETYELVERVRVRYPDLQLHTYRPQGVETVAEFDAKYGARLYETDSELYDWVAKVEPQQRAYADLGVAAVLTGRRRSQGGDRNGIGVIEVDEERGIVKINPLVRWSFEQVRDYVREHDIPYNTLLDKGYKSIGDWHSTSPVAEGEGERAGRWKGQEKSECGIHNKKSRYAMYLQELARKQARELEAALQTVKAEQTSETDTVAEPVVEPKQVEVTQTKVEATVTVAAERAEEAPTIAATQAEEAPTITATEAEEGPTFTATQAEDAPTISAAQIEEAPTISATQGKDAPTITAAEAEEAPTITAAQGKEASTITVTEVDDAPTIAALLAPSSAATAEKVAAPMWMTLTAQ